MARKLAYWASTGLVAAMSLFAGFAYLSGSPQAVQGFAHVGYPQQLRIILGIAKPLGAIALLVPGVPKLKEWAYAGFTFAWISAFFAHYLGGDGPRAFSPLVLLLLLVVSYLTRPASRQEQAEVAPN
jgi:DoxX-like family